MQAEVFLLSYQKNNDMHNLTAMFTSASRIVSAKSHQSVEVQLESEIIVSVAAVYQIIYTKSFSIYATLISLT